MVNIRISELMGKRRLTQKQLAELTGIRPNTISDLWHGRTKRIEISHMEALCKALQCEVGDLFEYVATDRMEDATEG